MVVKVNVSMSQDLLEGLDRAARETGASRSALLSRAAKIYLEAMEEQKRGEQRRLEVSSIRKLARKIGKWDGTVEVLKWRDAH